MIIRKVKCDDSEPNEKTFPLPSQKEHLLQVTDYHSDKNNPDVVIVRLEVVGSDEAGRSLLHRISLDDSWKGFFLTRLFLKIIGEPYKGEFEINCDQWLGRRFYATIIHNSSNAGKIFPNIDKFNFEKKAEGGLEPIIHSEVKFDE